METEAQLKRGLMAEEFQYQMQLAKARVGAEQEREKEIENRKDKRVQMVGTQQSEMINQRQNDSLPSNFESTGNDNLEGFGLGDFGPS